ncbi:MAG TPA: GNAT family protein [Thermomicrobiales bacterium]|jgi:RimJ/RimL family protein N-acetyltransferase|nr:N-acetyltransferase [Chloroflexota bacterium]HBY45031.1 N-acetyltransferase [Chloroflexota bacterium]HQZ90001.1 GNAT family protein [Thermomicrobiales bacterium]HRA31191.1 GNAT family protein [Thermomicrobiales bacterium]
MLHGPRITLRAIGRDDLPRLWRFNNDLAVELAGGGDPPMPQAFERLAADFERDWAAGGRDGSVFAIETDGEFIGMCQISHFDRTAHTAELGIAIGDKDYWSQGYGREAIGLLLEYAFRYRNLRRVWLWCHAANARGIAAYHACGFIEEGRLRQHVWSNGRYDDAVYMGVLRAEWEARQPGG